MEKPMPLVNSALLSSKEGETVRLVGKIRSVTSQVQLILIASDQGSVEVNLSNDSPLSYAREGQFIEVVGKVVQGGDGIKEYTSMFLSDTVDLDLVEQAVTLSSHFPQLFTDEGGDGQDNY